MNHEKTIGMMKYEELCGGKYQYRLRADYVHETLCEFPGYLSNGWITVIPNRIMIFKEGFCWNGLDFFPELENSQRGSLVHDGFCQLVNSGQLFYYPFRKDGDRELKRTLLKDRVNRFLVEIIYLAVRAYAQIKY